MAPRSSRGRLSRGPRFVIEVLPGGREAAHGRQRVGTAATQRAAIGRVCEVMQQWANAEGAIAPDTRMSIVDTETANEILAVDYLGYQQALPLGGERTWSAASKPTPTPTP